MAENKFNATVSALFEGMDSVISSKTVVGDAIHVGDIVIIPLMDVSFAVGAGAFNKANNNESGAGGLGGKMSPSAVLVIQNGKTKLVNVKNQDTIVKILDMIPDVIDRIKEGKEGKMTEEDVVEILDNALIYSDNIYFAKAALKIGSEEMESSLTGLGFKEELPFEIKMAKSQYSNSEEIETEIQLADSGYGQGQVLVNPLHMACIYSAFCNEGNIIKPYLKYQREAVAEYWFQGAFSNETANLVLEGIKKVVNDSNGTGYAAHRDDILLAGKTGTAEIKASKDDTSGTELGWFAIFTAEDTVERPILIISMVEDVKGRGGSGYVVKKDSQVLEDWFNDN